MTVALLLPGMSLNATIFPALDLPVVTPDFTRVVFGPDGASPDLLARRLGAYAERLEATLRTQLEWQDEHRIVVAHSFGAMLALRWWLDAGGTGSARVDGMVLCSTTAGPLYAAARLGRSLRLPLAPVMKLWNRPGVTRLAKRVLAGGLHRTETVDFGALPTPTDWAIDVAGWRQTDWRSMRSFRLALDGFDLRRRLGEVRVPVIVLHGVRDPVLPKELGVALALGLPRGELRLVDGAGHGLPLTHGDHVRRAVRDLLERA